MQPTKVNAKDLFLFLDIMLFKFDITLFLLFILAKQFATTQRISTEKCQGYSRWMQRPNFAAGSKAVYQRGHCANVVETFIINGVGANKLDFPHMAHVGLSYPDGTDLRWSCGGSLISERYVLTAAHCFSDREGRSITHVRLGAGDHRSIKIYKVENATKHPDYKPKEHYHDIALLLIPRVTFNDYRRPACLHTESLIPYKAGVVSGWGKTEASDASRRLLKTKVDLKTEEECRSIYPKDTYPTQLPRGIDYDIQICAGGHNDTCAGDSGGPMQVGLKDPECMYDIIGVTSFGLGCGLVAGVYTRVSAYVPWIESIVWP